MRPRKLIGFLGTHTEVGKTFVASTWLRELRDQGLRVAARKPVQSFGPGDAYTDADRLADATGGNVGHVCPDHRSYPLAWAPPIAADALKRPSIAINDLLLEIDWPADLDVGVVETVGGPLSPLAHDGDSIDLLRSLTVDHIVLVADAGLGTLNAIRLCIPAIAPRPIVYLNRFDGNSELHTANRRWLRERYGIATATSTLELSEFIPLERHPSLWRDDERH